MVDVEKRRNPSKHYVSTARPPWELARGPPGWLLGPGAAGPRGGPWLWRLSAGP